MVGVWTSTINLCHNNLRYCRSRRRCNNFVSTIIWVLLTLTVILHLKFYLFHKSTTNIKNFWEVAVKGREQIWPKFLKLTSRRESLNLSKNSSQSLNIIKVTPTKKPMKKVGPQKPVDIQKWFNSSKQPSLEILSKQFKALLPLKVVRNSSQTTCSERCLEEMINKLYGSNSLMVWRSTKLRTYMCKGKLELYLNKCVLLRNVTIIAKNAVVNDEEIVLPKQGFFSLACSDSDFYSKKQLSSVPFGPALEFKKNSTNQNRSKFVTDVTVAFSRNEYANVYWTMIDIYDLFLTSVMFKIPPQNMSIYLMDYHPPGHLDGFLTMFGNILRPVELNSPIKFRKLIWTFHREQSPMFEKKINIQLPLIKEFREYVLKHFSVPSHHTRNCEVLNIFIIWRRDYISHARNLQGKISRKISNEKEILKYLTQAFPKYNITGQQLDVLSIQQQLEIISHTDILIGMHGAGLAYTIFQPLNSAMIEIFPSYVGNNWHMGNLATRSGHTHLIWKNTNSRLDNKKNGTSIIPPNILQQKIKFSASKLC